MCPIVIVLTARYRSLPAIRPGEALHYGRLITLVRNLPVAEEGGSRKGNPKCL